ncbi:RNA polymerase sigma factor [Shewanella marina]|uniref:RNA polymerase sigma factor n=1 Tax=Shewanella marina TaxID=487319 RepID=UPI0004702894|nr:sigma-70 family RNA polymerase sigma factor [Shewanella marina]
MNYDIEHALQQLYISHSPQLLAVLTRIFGAHQLQIAEDVLHDTYAQALTHWQQQGMPKQPQAWLTKAAKNRAIDIIRANRTQLKYATDLQQLLTSEWALTAQVQFEFEADNIKDDQLRMMFMCCHPDIKSANRLPFVLNVLCGMSTGAIADALFIEQSTVKKRLLRTKQQLREHHFCIPDEQQIPAALASVHTILYLLFNEGFYGKSADKDSNRQRCQEAIGLLKLLVDDSRFYHRDSLALFALMHFLIARIDAKTDQLGNIIPLDLQDRRCWQQQYLNTGYFFMSQAKKMADRGSSRFYYEAQIAEIHSQAESFADTDWPKIVTCYQHLFKLTQSPIIRLNQAIAMAYAGDELAALLVVEQAAEHKLLRQSYMPLATQAHIQAKLGHKQQAYLLAEQAQKQGGTAIEHQQMMSQIERLLAASRD